MSRIGIIAAMERELHPLIAHSQMKGWKRTSLLVEGHDVQCFENGDTVAAISGMGSKRAEATARAVVKKYQPEILISAGLAGALMRTLKVGNVVLPNVIVDAATGIEYRCNVGGEVIGGGVLVTTFEIVENKSKAELVECFHALIVDMEASGVAKVAQENDLGFRCVKAISDEFDFELPPLNRFVDGAGTFQTGSFVRWLSVRPWQWLTVLMLGRNSNAAAQALCDWLAKGLRGSLNAAKVVTLNGAESLRKVNPDK
jgi:adenosylhomocysteine nucleosidase